MNDQLLNKVFKFNIENTNFNVTLDNSFNECDINLNKLAKEDIHFHTEYELFIIINGNLQIIENNVLRNYENCILCIPPFFSHCSSRQGKFVYRFLFSFKQNYKTNISNTFSFFKHFFQQKVSNDYSDNMPTYLSIIENLLNKETESFQNEKIQQLLKLIFYEFLPKKNKGTNISYSNYLIKIDNFLFNHYTDNATLKDVASSLHLSLKQTSRIIMSNYHKSFNQLITEKRLSIACSKLIETDMSINDIIELLNFNSESNFFKLFKKHYGITPLQYRKKSKI